MSQPIRVWDQLQMREGLLAPTVPGENFVMSRTISGAGVGITQVIPLTQSQYDAIVTKDPATLYVIVEG
jgi:hypothetical protein